MDQTAAKTLEEIMENYKYNIKEENLSKEHFNLNIRCQNRLGDIMYDIRVIIKKLDDLHGKVLQNDIKAAKEKLENYYKSCLEMENEVEKELHKTGAILKGLYKDYVRYNSIKDVKETYKKSCLALLEQSINLFVKYEKQAVLIKDQINIIIKLYNININF